MAHQEAGDAARFRLRQAPDVLIARRSANGVVERARPIYPYPILARYSEAGIRSRPPVHPMDPSKP
jgi:hypothetical protein